MSRFEDYLNALLKGEKVDFEPQSRMEQYLKNCCDKCGCDGLPTPTSRGELLMYQLAEQLANGGGNNPTAPIEGTAIPVGEPVDRIYFNTNLSIEEIDAYLSQLTYVEGVLEYPTYIAFLEMYGSSISAYAIQNVANTYAIIYLEGTLPTNIGTIFVYANDKLPYPWSIDGLIRRGGETSDVSFIPNSHPFLVSRTSVTDFNGIPVGAENEKIKNVLSITPFGVRVEGGDTGESGIVVCNLETVTKETTINDLENLNLSLPNVTSIDDGVFENCTALTSIDLPNATIVGTNAFYNCSALTSIDLPNVTIVCAGAFENCTALTSIDLPNATIVSASVFENCTALTSIDLPKAATIDAVVFEGCTALDTLILRTTETVCNLDVSAVIDTKILTEEGMPTGEGFIYVPTAFYEQYVSNLAAQVMTMGYDEATATYLVTAVLRKIEDYPEICG